jgi:hypothetical protein
MFQHQPESDIVTMTAYVNDGLSHDEAGELACWPMEPPTSATQDMAVAAHLG